MRIKFMIVPEYMGLKLLRDAPVERVDENQLQVWQITLLA